MDDNFFGDFIKSKEIWGPIPTAPKGHSWENLMQIALETAIQGQGLGEIPVGAVVVDLDGNILSRAHNESIRLNDPTAHAEVLALRRAGKKLKNYRLLDCYLIVTLEPCLMCTGAIKEARLKGIVFGAYDLRAGAVCSILEGLTTPENGISTWHLGGILGLDCKQLLQNFFAEKR